jgi:type I restriction enzyme S subunit
MAEQVSSLKTGIKYKDTPIGKIPVDWEVVKLKNVGVLKGGTGFPEKYQGHRMLKYLFIKVSDMNLPGNEIYIKNSINTIEEENKNLIKCEIFPKDTIVFAKVGAALLLNRRRILTRESAIDNNMTGFVVRNGNDPKFYYYILQSIDFAKYFFSGALPSLNQNVIGNVEVVCPPIQEQKKIAELLTTVDEAIEKTDQIIEKTKEVKKGLMQRLLTRGIGHKKFKKTEIGEIPEEWEVGEISTYGEIVTGNTPPTNIPEYYGSEYPFVSPFDLGKKKTITKTEKYLSEDGFSVARSLPPNSVLVVCIGSTIGKTGIAGRELTTNQQINSIICKNNDYNFVYYYVTFISDKFRQLAGTQAVPILNKGNFSKVKVTIPPLSEQKIIGDILSSIDDEVEKESNHKNRLETLKKGLMQVLLTGKIRVSV